MGERHLSSGEALWTRGPTIERFVWVACNVRPKPGHARQVFRHQLDDGPVLCLACREPCREMSNTALARYKRDDRRCEACRLDDHHLCCKVACYGCPPELHRRMTGVVATRTPGPR